MRYGFGIDVGGTTVKLAFLDEDGTMLEKWEIPTRKEEGGKYILPDIAASVKDMTITQTEQHEDENLTKLANNVAYIADVLRDMKATRVSRRARS